VLIPGFVVRGSALEVEFKGELNQARAAHSSVIDPKRWRSNGKIRDSKVWMIEEIVKLSSKLQVQSLMYGKSLGDEGVPLLLEWPARLRDVPAEIAKERPKRSGSSLPPDSESLVAGAAERIQTRNRGRSVCRATSSRRPKYCRGTQNAWSKRACPCRGLIRKVLGRTGLQKVTQVTGDLRKECASGKSENVTGPKSYGVDAH
jgi:hypothetical protein